MWGLGLSLRRRPSIHTWKQQCHAAALRAHSASRHQLPWSRRKSLKGCMRMHLRTGLRIGAQSLWGTGPGSNQGFARAVEVSQCPSSASSAWPLGARRAPSLPCRHRLHRNSHSKHHGWWRRCSYRPRGLMGV